ncbi:class I SAM-dependent methyltransferase [Microbacterium sp. K35]|uniref:class I SAM-dependent methyltransferase n=1 Tax=Microbacterium sp. K35 TaxID=2305440 RepID=UPI00109BDAEB|nr:class I SAM-dependent methyltransferase [Microbacterium sp. K35]
MDDYWNHNTAYHRELVAAVRQGARVLDVGCGDGLLLQKLAGRASQVTGIDPDAAALSRARERFPQSSPVRLIHGDLLTSPDLEGQRFDLVTCVATLHHLPLIPALERLRDLLAPGGQLRIVGLSANASVLDWAISGALLLPIRVMSGVHRESGYPDMTTARPSESLTHIRDAAATILPGSQVRRRFYYRYSLTWTKPA